MAGARAGDRYRYAIDGRGPFPDPASRYQPEGVHGPSEVVDPGQFRWSDRAWKGLTPEELVVYELHVGTFSPEGTFEGVAKRLETLRDLGVTAIELMPLADFAGCRSWGYDGVDLFAPARCYGTPDDLRRLVDEAHRLGLGVMLDVVYNHFGPGGQLRHRVQQAVPHLPGERLGRLRQPRRGGERAGPASSSSRTPCTGCTSITSTACAWTPRMP